jgi:hypothetical protein
MMGPRQVDQAALFYEFSLVFRSRRVSQSGRCVVVRFDAPCAYERQIAPRLNF